jgi:hypothetical protein
VWTNEFCSGYLCLLCLMQFGNVRSGGSVRKREMQIKLNNNTFKLHKRIKGLWFVKRTNLGIVWNLGSTRTIGSQLRMLLLRCTWFEKGWVMVWNFLGIIVLYCEARYYMPMDNFGTYRSTTSQFSGYYVRSSQRPDPMWWNLRLPLVDSLLMPGFLEPTKGMSSNLLHGSDLLSSS